MESLRSAIERRWYGKPGGLLLLWPLEKLFDFISARRKRKLVGRADQYPVPVIVIGNISVGGTGKTPTIIALAKHLHALGKKPGVVSRGYGRVIAGSDQEKSGQSSLNNDVLFVDEYSQASEVGDEPLLIYRSSPCEVAVCQNRSAAITELFEQKACDVILADDGLQHYSMSRAAEVVVVDGQRLFGNGHLLPVGPLRESPNRLRQASWVLVNMPSGMEDAEAALQCIHECIDFTEKEALEPDVHRNSQHKPQLKPQLKSENIFAIGVEPKVIRDVVTLEEYSCDKLREVEGLVAVVGLGNPSKFFSTLDTLGVQYERRVFPDHHSYGAEDFADLQGKTLVMTEKDAVKCRDLMTGTAYALVVDMQLPGAFLASFSDKIEEICSSV